MSEYSEKELLYSAVIESSGDAILTKTLDGIITSWNPAAERLYGYTKEEVIGKSINIIVPKDLQSEIHSILKRIRSDRKVEHHETIRIGKNGRLIHVSLTISPVKTASGLLIGASAIARDITEKKVIEEVFDQNINDFPILINSDPKIVWITDAHGNFIDSSQSEFNLSSQLFKEREKLFYETIHPEDLPLISAFKNQVIKNQKLSGVEFRFWSGDGQWNWGSMVALPVNDENSLPFAWIGITLNITRQKRLIDLFIMQLSKTTDQLRHLAMRINSRVENESQRIAIEVHDQIGGNLVGIKHDLERISKDAKDFFEQEKNLETKKILEETFGLVVKTIGTVKKISSELHPAELDYLGLVSAIHSEIETFSKRFGILCEFDVGIEETSLNKEQELAAFRVFQEILRNVRRHANADKIKINLTQDENYFYLLVADNGRGITDTGKKAEKSLGLLGMKERIQQIGGKFEIKGVEGLGTTVNISIPLLVLKLE